jgi:NAD+--asparagine ADP-ribosyltransferase
MAMKKPVFLLLIVSGLISCSNKDGGPDVSGIKVTLVVSRFDEAFFGMDTTNIDKSIQVLNRNYPQFLQPFLQTIVGVNDAAGIKTFFRLHKTIFDSAQKKYKNFEPVKKDLENAFRHVKFYFPSYKLPTQIIPIVGPMNSIDDMAKMTNGDYNPDFVGPDFLGISLQFYLGKDFPFYNADYFINNVAPLYRSRRFDSEYITADAMKVISDDLFPDKSNTMSLIDQMIEKGKRWWLIDKFLPDTPDSVKTGYTQKQLQWCEENEGLIWSYIIKNEDLHTINPVTIQTYIGEAPFTQGFSQEYSPGNIGSWIGWQIVKRFATNNAALTPAKLMAAPAKQILEEAKYKPK